MALIICPYCGEKVSDSNSSCIFCKKVFVKPKAYIPPAQTKPQKTYVTPQQPIKKPVKTAPTLLASARRAPLHSSLKGPMILCIIAGVFLLFCALIGFISESTGGPGLGNVGGGTTIITGSSGNFFFSPNGISLALIAGIVSFVLLIIGFTILAIDIQHKNDNISVFEDHIEFSSKNVFESYKLSDLDSCNLVKGVTIKIKIKGIDTHRSIFCVNNAEQVVKTIYYQQQLLNNR